MFDKWFDVLIDLRFQCYLSPMPKNISYWFDLDSLLTVLRNMIDLITCNWHTNLMHTFRFKLFHFGMLPFFQNDTIEFVIAEFFDSMSFLQYNKWMDQIDWWSISFISFFICPNIVTLKQADFFNHFIRMLDKFGYYLIKNQIASKQRNTLKVLASPNNC